MLKAIKLNLEEIESMLYFWHACSDKEKISEVYLHEIASMPGLSCTYDKEFDSESVRKVLSAITNREILSSKTQKEGRFWNYNMWMLEDMEYTGMMVSPVKQLNLDSLTDELRGVDSPFEEVEVRFSPLHFDEYIIKDNSLIINFFRVKPDDFDDTASISGIELKDYVKMRLEEMLSK